jgi:hypothetical protein
MWEPSIHEKWKARQDAVRRLSTAQDYLAYARANHIRYVVLESSGGTCGADARVLKQTGKVQLCEVGS